MRSFFLPNWSPPDDPARPLPAEGRPWPSDHNDDDDDDDDDDDVDNNGDLESVIMVSHVLDSADDTARLPHLGSDQIIFI